MSPTVQYLESDDTEENVDGDVDVLADENKHARHELTEQVENDEEHAEPRAGAPRVRDVLTLLVPLQPHAYAVLEERAHETQARQCRQVVLAVFKNLYSLFFNQFIINFKKFILSTSFKELEIFQTYT